MATVAFTSHLQAVAPSEPVRCDGATVAELLGGLWGDYPRLRGYLLDDHGRVRKHIAIFVDGALHPRETVLDAPVAEAGEVYVMQALSGG